jgi:hypothetical protein
MLAPVLEPADRAADMPCGERDSAISSRMILIGLGVVVTTCAVIAAALLSPNLGEARGGGGGGHGATWSSEHGWRVRQRWLSHRR